MYAYMQQTWHADKAAREKSKILINNDEKKLWPELIRGCSWQIMAEIGVSQRQTNAHLHILNMIITL